MMHSLKSSRSVLILGQGYVGTHLLRDFPHAQSTRRSTFELARPETWEQNEELFRASQLVIWTFPAASNELEEHLATQFFDLHLSHARVIIYGTTSAYRVQKKDEWVDETTALDMTQVRTRTEEKLRQKGACIVHLSGIFGPGRLPLNWYLRGLIQSASSYLNLIHVDNIVSITEKMTHLSHIEGQRFNLSNGKPKTHDQIVLELKALKLLPEHYALPAIERADSKRVSNAKIKSLLNLSDSDFIEYP